jgi:RNA polymerase sigma factor (TIGR02999 family)
MAAGRKTVITFPDTLACKPASITTVPKDNERPLEREFEAVYGELRRIAARQLRGERRDHTLSATALVHEAFLKLSESGLQWNDRHHFCGVAARAMRQVLVNHALARRADKRGGDWVRLTLTGAVGKIERGRDEAIDVIGLDDALKSLEALDPRQAQIVELRYFGGLSIEDTARAVDLSPATVKREWAVARLYLKRALTT